MATKKIKNDDLVMILTGKSKGRTGKVKHVGNDRVIVENVNLMKKHVRPNPQKNIQGGVVEKEMSMHISNVAVINPRSKKRDRVGFKMVSEGGNTKKVRCYKSDGEIIV